MELLKRIFKKNYHANLEDSRDITDDVVESDFIPYACHYNPHTILTKNGELLQTIRIESFNYEVVEGETQDLRAAIRKAVMENIPNDNFAIWFHTIRRRKSLDQGGAYPDAFSGHLNRAWQKQYDWPHKFANELYVTIVHDGQSASLVKPVSNFFRGLFPAVDRKYREAYLDAIYPALDTVMQGVLEALKPYGGKRLGIVEHDGVCYSEPCNFLSKIVNLTDVAMPVPDIDLSYYLTTQEITFGYNAMEVRSRQGNRRFGAILTLKEYKELSAAAIDQFLQQPVEFIISQCVDFINHSTALADYEYQSRLMGLSGDASLAKSSGLADIVASNRQRLTDYGEQQLSVFLQADDLRTLERYVARAVSVFTSLGIVPVREDIKFEECYWAQMPGNFEFVKRLKSINTRRVAGFANLCNFPMGKEKDNHWGDAVTVLYTAARTPYFFNFHIGDNGHTSVVGPPGSGKTVLINFLLSEARKFNYRLFFFDVDRTSEIFIRSIGGQYIHCTPDSRTLPPMNPLRLPDNEKNRRFLAIWVTCLLQETEDMLSAEEKAQISQAIANLYQQPESERTLRHLHRLLAAARPEWSEPLSAWVEGGAYAAYFDHETDGLDFSGSAHGFELAQLMEEDTGFLPVFAYLLHRATQTLGETRTIFAFKEAWQMLDNPLYGPRLQSWLDWVRTHNGMTILSTEQIEQTLQSGISRELMGKIATQIYLPDPNPSEAYRQVFRLPDKEFAYLSLMDPEERHCLLKRGSETVVAELNLAGLDEVIAVLSGDADRLALMEQLMRERGESPASWLPKFLTHGEAA